MSIQALVWVIEHSKSRLADRCVLISIANHCDRQGENAWPSVYTISHEAKVTVRQVQISVRRLIKGGELVVAKNKGAHGTNLYSLPKVCQGDPLLFGCVPKTEGGGEISSGVKNLRGEDSSCRVHIPSAKRQYPSPEPSVEPPQEPSIHTHHSSSKWQQDDRRFAYELHDMRRTGGIGKATRDLWRERLKDPSEVAKVPEWFRREAEKLLAD